MGKHRRIVPAQVIADCDACIYHTEDPVYGDLWCMHNDGPDDMTYVHPDRFPKDCPLEKEDGS